MKVKFQILFIICLQISFLSNAQKIEVPSDHSTIQAAIEAANVGDSIIVSPGTYLENINFKGKDLFLSSLFYLANDRDYISTTIIDGSQPSNPDSASVVLFVNGETRAAVIQGFTITGGKGTKFHNDIENFDVRIGGGILGNSTSPTIRFNHLIDNEAINANGVLAAGGGAARLSSGKPIITNNIIEDNRGLYAGGLMIANCFPTIRNNVFLNNNASTPFNGGGGLYIDFNLETDSTITIVNNTFVGNESGSAGGGMIVTGTTISLKNNIFWGNTAPNNPQIFQRNLSGAPNGIAEVEFSNVEGGWTGNGNIDSDPLFEADGYSLSVGSPCIDAGDGTVSYYDHVNPLTSGTVYPPSQGTPRNDMGATGGPYLPLPIDIVLNDDEIERSRSYQLLYSNPFNAQDAIQLEILENGLDVGVELFDGEGKLIEQLISRKYDNGSHTLSFSKLAELPKGMYFISVNINSIKRAHKLMKL